MPGVSVQGLCGKASPPFPLQDLGRVGNTFAVEVYFVRELQQGHENGCKQYPQGLQAETQRYGRVLLLRRILLVVQFQLGLGRSLHLWHYENLERPFFRTHKPVLDSLGK